MRSRLVRGSIVAVAAVVTAAGCNGRPVGVRFEPEPRIERPPPPPIDKIDLLFVIDDSPSMADKQAIFAEAVPTLLRGLRESATGPEGAPISDIHVRVISSSLGRFGGDLGEAGGEYEALDEAWYRFLVQPDPWERVTLDGDGRAQLEGVDAEVIRQRADFLRPDSLVAIVVLTDEDDASVDPLAIGGMGWAFTAKQFPGSTVSRADRSTTAPRPTTACASDPASPDCTSCMFASTCNTADPACQKIKSDPSCLENGGYYGADEEALNVRFHRMKQRYGVDPQYPIQRYVDGLTKRTTPDRTTEHVVTESGGHRVIAGYTGAPKCTNPLFAKALPREAGDPLCTLLPGTRSSDQVLFAVIGGVPSRLLHFAPNDPEASELTDADWVKILGRDPMNFDYSGIDPHMIPSVEPRRGLPPPSATRGDNGDAERDGFREWDTHGGDLQYACTFDLPTARTCTSDDPSCDCADPETNPPVCGATLGAQIKAKAYPTVRPFEIARALRERGIAASICPSQLTDPTAPTYGYAPAFARLLRRIQRVIHARALDARAPSDADAP